jgi:isopentenyl phosphate kinase
MKINIIKFGGSVISDNSSENNFNLKNTERLAKEFFPFHKGSILIHGTGYVGKPPAIKYGYVKHGIISKEDKLIALAIKSRIRQLNQNIVSTLISASIPAVPVDILNYYTDQNELNNIEKTGTTIPDLLDNGVVPVFYGDLFPRPDGSYKVISSDLLTFLLAKALKPENVIFLSNVKGIYVDEEAIRNDTNQGIIKVLTLEKMTEIRWSDNYYNDVSGGMRRKAELALEISGYCNKCFIGSGYTENVLSKILKGELVEGTLVNRFQSLS